MGRKGKKKLYQFLDDLVAIGVRELGLNADMPEERARTLMTDIAHGICFQYARSYMYVPADLEFKLSQRDKEIWRTYQQDSAAARKFTPARIAELAEEYRLTTVQIYNIIRLLRSQEQEARATHFLALQGTLPGLDTASVPSAG